jgi:hypothetical protein
MLGGLTADHATCQVETAHLPRNLKTMQKSQCNPQQMNHPLVDEFI